MVLMVCLAVCSPVVDGIPAPSNWLHRTIQSPQVEWLAQTRVVSRVVEKELSGTYPNSESVSPCPSPWEGLAWDGGPGD